MPEAVLLDPPKNRWECPNCDVTAVTDVGTLRSVEGRLGVFKLRPGEKLAQMHHCRGLAGLLAPMVPAGTRCKAEAHEREDYIGEEDPDDLRFDGEGRPIMNVVITRDHGTDCAVYAPTATDKLEV